MKNIYEKILDGPQFLIGAFLFNEYGRPLIFAKLKVAIILQFFFILYLLKDNIFDYCRKNKYKVNLIKVYLILLALMVFHTLFSKNNFWAYQYLKTVTSYFLLYLMIIKYVNSFKKIENLIIIIVGINIYCAILGIINGGKVPYNGFMGDENDFALVMNIILPITLFVAISMKGKMRYILCAAIIVYIIALIFSISRGGILGFFTVTFCIWLYFKRKIIVMVTLILGALIIFQYVPDDFKQEFYSIFEQGGSSGTGRARLIYWKVATRVFVDNPVIGVGQGNLPWIWSDYQEPDEYVRGLGGKVVHSIYFTVLPELGSVGIILFYLFIQKSYQSWKIIRKRCDFRLELYSTGLSIGMVGFLSSGAFLSVLYYPHFWILTSLINASCFVCENENDLKY